MFPFIHIFMHESNDDDDGEVCAQDRVKELVREELVKVLSAYRSELEGLRTKYRPQIVKLLEIIDDIDEM